MAECSSGYRAFLEPSTGNLWIICNVINNAVRTTILHSVIDVLSHCMGGEMKPHWVQELISALYYLLLKGLAE